MSQASSVFFAVYGTALRKTIGGWASRSFSITNISKRGVSLQVKLGWMVLKAFDRSSPLRDYSQTIKSARGWFAGTGLVH